MPVSAGVSGGRAGSADVVPKTGFVAAERSEPDGVGQDHQAARPGDPQHLVTEPPGLRDVLGHIGREAHVDTAVGERQGQPGGPDEAARPATPDLPGGVHFPRVRFDADVAPSRVGERGREIAGAATHVDHRAAVMIRMKRVPQVGHQGFGIRGQCAVEPRRIGLLEAELTKQSGGPGQRRAPGEQVGDVHRTQLSDAGEIAL